MKKLLAPATLGLFLMAGNLDQSANPASDKPTDQGQKVVSELQIGGNTLTFISRGGNR